MMPPTTEPTSTETILAPLPSSRLFYRDGGSDKVYHASINAQDGGFTVTFAFGRRGSALTVGTKTTAPVAWEKAQQIYDKLLAEKAGKGYTPDGTGALFAMTGLEGRRSGLHPQLLNSISEEAAEALLADPAWCLQEKFDGRRIMVAVTGGIPTGSNRKGLCVPLAQEVSDALAPLLDCEMDGELLSDSYVVFDLLKSGETDCRAWPYRERYEALTVSVRASPTPALVVAETAWDAVGKWALYDRIAQAGGEGVVFKKADGQYVAGRPASGGSQVKCKFYATCTCLVTAQNDQRSVRLHLLDDAGKTVGVGNVTIPPNKALPAAGTLVEIRYLYAYKGGSLYQATYLGERDDLEVGDCILGQLKYKAEGGEAEGEE